MGGTTYNNNVGKSGQAGGSVSPVRNDMLASIILC